MMNYIFVVFIAISIIAAIFTGQGDQLAAAIPLGAQKGKKKEATKPSKRTNLKTQGKRLSNEKKFIEKFLGDNKKKKRK